MTLSNPAQYISGRTVQEQMNSLIDYVDQRAADVALDAIASDVAQVHQDMLDADADAAAAAASAAAAAGTLANAVKKTGESSQSIAGDIAISGNLTVGGTAGFTGAVTVPAPANNTDAATKKYVDDTNALDVKLAGAQAITGAKTVPLEATGTFSDQIASSNKVKNELDNYAPMVRTTGNQSIAGNKNFIAPVFGDAVGVTINRSFGYYKTHKLAPVGTDGTWYMNLMFAWRYGFTLVHCEFVVAGGVITNVTTTDLLGRTQSGNTKVAFDIIDGDVYLVVNRVSQSNVYSRIALVDLQVGASSHPVWTRLTEGELYTPAGPLIEANLI